MEAGMSAGKVIGYIVAIILIFFGVLFIWGAFSPNGQVGWIIVGIISVAIGLGIIWLVSRRRPAAEGEGTTIVQKIELPGNVSMDTLKCRSCGAALTPKDITMVAGAPVVNCPYCHTTYQLTEEPKW
jgi:Na+/melibiose symporter-like transporter